ncbi:ATP-dependent helicase HrpB [Palleronia caenipelagi]|uniref:ATP-dependent helicase HrpB n=1 Tax=Palleronia caenipelagi TaxID=2489174 RepID=A0A547Q863_9RHOB|nr:ATP-dependent helicase HrpB [Palleronia caenipelagi]TRD22574.1 ATP-dependent helicase HrpB [Palleronia caenipelagi]
MDLPIDAILPDLRSAVTRHGRAVLQAPPGAGKTTRVPLALLEEVEGRIVMLEPRRLAARAAAERMAATLGEKVGETVGYAIRGERVVSDATRIEVVTEGILTRRIQSDPGLGGIGCVIFDEFHERSLNADLGLALVWEVRQALREDLAVIVMSATLDAAPVAALLDDAPMITSEGRSHPVTPRWLDRPLPKGTRFEVAIARLITEAIMTEESGVLAFLPGEGEIRRVMGQLDLPGVEIRPLYGAMPFAEQRRAIRPADGRKLVLATAIAETSLTIEDVRIVVDGGRARRARFDPGSGMTRLVTERVSRAEAAQRAGRAGRVAPGTAWKLWTKGEEGALPAFPPAEIEVADLTALALELALWGDPDGSGLPFLTPPPPSGLAEAQALLAGLGALEDGRITDHGRALARMPLHPRLGHMLAKAGPAATDLAALLSERDLLRDRGADLTLRLRALRNPAEFAVARGAVERVRSEAKRLRRHAGPTQDLSPAQMAALAYPDRVGLRRPGDAPRWLLSGGKGAQMAEGDALAGQRLLVVTDTDGHPRDATIRQAIAISEGELRAVLGDRMGWVEICEWSRRDRRVVTRRQERLGAIALDDRTWPDAPPDRVARAMLDGVRELGLRPSDAARRFLARVALLELFDTSEEALLAEAEDWLLPFLDGVRTASDWTNFDILPALRARLDYAAQTRLDQEVPGHLETPLGRRVPIDYSSEAPEVAVRVQELFGMTRHPTVAGRPLRLSLLSPAGRPVQFTQDLPGFWAGSYADVAKDMRARYPKHPWPDDPTEADPTLRAKRRKG